MIEPCDGAQFSVSSSLCVFCFVFFTRLDVAQPLIRCPVYSHTPSAMHTHTSTTPTVEAHAQMMALLSCSLVTPYVSVFLNRHK